MREVLLGIIADDHLFKTIIRYRSEHMIDNKEDTLLPSTIINHASLIVNLSTSEILINKYDSRHVNWSEVFACVINLTSQQDIVYYLTGEQ